jgi:predicted SnoaL-like aldol condensation-catalyzing enzyme
MGRRTDNARSLYLDAIGEGDYVEAINTYAGARYTQHSTPVKDGKDGFIEFFADFVRRNPVRDIEIVRAFEDGRYVFLHVVQTLNNGEYRYVTADIFDTDDDAKLIEHWDIIDELRDATVGGRSQVDGPTAISGLDETEGNKQLVARFVDDVLVPGDYDRLGEFVSADLAQHSPDVADGLAAFQAFAAESSMRYIELHLVVGSGDFVAILAESELHGDRYAVIDLFRVDRGEIVEHWDVTERITPENTWVNSGKF